MTRLDRIDRPGALLATVLLLGGWTAQAGTETDTPPRPDFDCEAQGSPECLLAFAWDSTAGIEPKPSGEHPVMDLVLEAWAWQRARAGRATEVETYLANMVAGDLRDELAISLALAAEIEGRDGSMAKLSGQVPARPYGHAVELLSRYRARTGDGDPLVGIDQLNGSKDGRLEHLLWLARERRRRGDPEGVERIMARFMEEAPFDTWSTDPARLGVPRPNRGNTLMDAAEILAELGDERWLDVLAPALGLPMMIGPDQWRQMEAFRQQAEAEGRGKQFAAFGATDQGQFVGMMLSSRARGRAHDARIRRDVATARSMIEGGAKDGCARAELLVYFAPELAPTLDEGLQQEVLATAGECVRVAADLAPLRASLALRRGGVDDAGLRTELASEMEWVRVLALAGEYRLANEAATALGDGALTEHDTGPTGPDVRGEGKFSVARRSFQDALGQRSTALHWIADIEARRAAWAPLGETLMAVDGLSGEARAFVLAGVSQAVAEHEPGRARELASRALEALGEAEGDPWLRIETSKQVVVAALVADDLELTGRALRFATGALDDHGLSERDSPYSCMHGTCADDVTSLQADVVACLIDADRARDAVAIARIPFPQSETNQYRGSSMWAMLATAIAQQESLADAMALEDVDGREVLGLRGQASLTRLAVASRDWLPADVLFRRLVDARAVALGSQAFIEGYNPHESPSRIIRQLGRAGLDQEFEPTTPARQLSRVGLVPWATLQPTPETGEPRGD